MIGEITVYQQKVLASEPLTQFRGVQVTGAAVTAGGNGFIAPVGGAIGQLVPLVVLGCAMAEAGGTVAAGARLEFDSLGRVITRSTGVIIGRAIQGATVGNLTQVIVIPS